MNSDKRRCTLKVEVLKFQPILFHQMPSSLLYVTKSENLFFSFFDRGTLEGNLESFVHKMSIFALNVKSRKNIKPKGNQKYINKTLRHYNYLIGGVFSEKRHFSFPLEGVSFQMKLKQHTAKGFTDLGHLGCKSDFPYSDIPCSAEACPVSAVYK